MKEPLLAGPRRHLRRYKLFVLASEAKWSILESLDGIHQRARDRIVVSLQPERSPRGALLLSYLTEPFLLPPDQPIPGSSPSEWQSFLMARTFLELGYAVDVIRFNNDRFWPQRDYSVVIDIRSNLVRFASRLPRNCLKTMHLDHANVMFQNAAEFRRLLELQERRGITLAPRRFMMPPLGFDVADCATIRGNKFTMSTYQYANKPLYPLPSPAAVERPWPAAKDWETSRQRFLWLGGSGLVHKGLDLVLEAFAEMPEYHLTVCGPIQLEKDFEAAFFDQLYRTPNIHTRGWLDLTTPQFAHLVDDCGATIYPSCSEGQSGAVIQCMHAGLIPIVSYESGVDVEGFGFVLRRSSIPEIKDAIRMVATLPARELKDRAHSAWEFARANHTRAKFAEDYGKAVLNMLSLQRDRLCA